MVRVQAAPSLALVKYWGKSNAQRNLPATPSLAVTVTGLHTEVGVQEAAGDDSLTVDGTGLPAQRHRAFFDAARAVLGVTTRYRAVARNNFPGGAGLASSASLFAALAVACGEMAGVASLDRERSRLSALARERNMPVIWTYVAYMDNADDAGVWGTRTDTENSLQNIKEGGERSELDPRLEVDRERDAVVNKRMASVFHDSLIPSLLVWHKVDTVILTGGSTSGCVRASAVASLSHGYRTIVPEECVADKHEIPHFANLCDIMLKYADVEPFATVAGWLENHPGCAPIRQARGAGF